MADRIKITTEQDGYTYEARELVSYQLLTALDRSLTEKKSPFYQYTEGVGGEQDTQNRYIKIDIDPFEADFTYNLALVKKKKLYVFKNLIEYIYSKLYDNVVYVHSAEVGITIQFLPATGVIQITSNLVGSQTDERLYSLILSTATEQYLNMQRRYLNWVESGLSVNADGSNDTNFFLFPIFN
jgi:hypothetical protein